MVSISIILTITIFFPERVHLNLVHFFLIFNEDWWLSKKEGSKNETILNNNLD